MEEKLTQETGPVLYRSWSGFDVREFSYSMSADIAKCGTYTEYSRFQGLTEKVESAAMKFGICCEESVYDHYRFGLDLEEGFRAKWSNYQDKILKYSKNDSSWANLETAGKMLMREFERQRDNIPIHAAEFTLKMPVDPNATWYNGTRLVYLADCVSHPFEGDILIDIKTSGRSYPEGDDQNAATYGYPALDPQLRTGALVSGIRTVGFLVLVKTRYPKIQFHTGYVTDTLLANIDAWLKEQYHRILDHKLVMDSGVRWPNDKCTQCCMLQLCLGRPDQAELTLRRKSSKETEENLAVLDEM